ncbi:TonB-dependent receptor [Stutzerimonas stutzeri]|uniref:TonB-dependent receptor n=1 Tax=Stutzerimonas stutzeri TaxID=316 RepID=UPI0015E432C4|nr:TonB-dependent receptor [Stutzerimonas stutzeri]MBA1264158.1 TonB-dependent receptor [Stutzerimonas stutzeri]
MLKFVHALPPTGWLLLGWLLCSQALAEQPTSVDGEKGVVLEAMTVTARHREEVSQQVPIALSVLDGDALEEAGLHRLQDIQQRVPGLVVSGHGARYAGFGLRGFGATAYNDGLDGSVGVFVDGVYLGRQGMAFAELLDVERVEVLRGPQGTLFGKNTSAGVVNIVTRPPTPFFEAAGEMTLGERGTREYRGNISGPLLEGELAGRLSAFHSGRDGQVDNLHDGSSLNDLDSQGLRGQLLWTPNDRFSVRLSGENAWQENHGPVLMSNHYSTQTRQRADFVGYRLSPSAPYRREVRQNSPTRSRTEQNATALELNWDMRDDLRLTSITAYRDWDFTDQREADGTALAVARSGSRLEHSQFSQEFRLSGAASEQLDYVLGLYYLRQRLERDIGVRFGDEAAAWFLGDRPELALLGITDPAQIPSELLAGTSQAFDGEQKGDSRALFGQLAWSPFEQLEVTAGLRYTRERKDGWISREVTGERPLGPDMVSQIGGPLLRQVALGGSYYRRDSIGESNHSGLLGASYHFTDQMLGYVSWSRGHKAGGINFDVTGTHVGPTYGAERATSLEAGLKTRLWGQRATLDLAVYQTDVDDYQALTYSPPANSLAPPLRDNLLNVGRVRLRGVELDSLWRLHEQLDLRLGAAWSDARYKRFPNGPCAPGSDAYVCDLGGKRLYNAPEWNASAGLDYRQPLTTRHEAFGVLDYSFRSGYYGTLEGGEGSWQPAFGLTHLRLGLRRIDRRWEVEAWVHNLFDRESITAVYALLGAGDYGVLPGDPRTFGMTLRARY